MDLISELNQRSKKAPEQIRYITLYNLINFFGSLILSIIAFVLYVVLIPDDQFTIANSLLIGLCLSIVVVLNYIILKITMKFILGSIRAYWFLFILFLIQCIGIRIGDNGFNLELGGIPITFAFSIGSFYFKANIAAIFFTLYLIGIKDKYNKYISLPSEERNLKSNL